MDFRVVPHEKGYVIEQEHWLFGWRPYKRTYWPTDSAIVYEFYVPIFKTVDDAEAEMADERKKLKGW